jgi:hypothetical protein
MIARPNISGKRPRAEPLKLGSSHSLPAQVAVKVDIDTPFAELAIVEAIADRPDIAARVDELFFEYHFNYDGLDFGWKCQKIAGRCQGDVDTAVGLMRRLRQLGVRAHFWI